MDAEERQRRLVFVEKLKGTNATNVCDALRKMGYAAEKLATSALKPVNELSGSVVGMAVTIKNQPSRRRGTPQEIRDLVFTPIDESQPGDVVVFESGTQEIYSEMGGLMALAIKKRGAEAAIIDGGCRDIGFMKEIDLPVFSKGTCLYGPGNFTRTVACNVPVTISGIEINPGDILVADRDGIIVIPPEALGDELLESVQGVVDKEALAEEALRSGKSLRQYYPLSK